MRRPVLAAATAAFLLPTAAADAAAPGTTYARCADVPGTSIVQAARIACAEAELLATKVAAAPGDDTPQVLRDEGWAPLRARPATDGFDLTALRGRAAVRFRRPGRAPDLDGWAAGRELVFSRSRIVGGAPIPRDAAVCSTAFLIRQRGGAPGGLSAAHCAGLRSDGTTQRRNAALRRPPVAGIVLGRVTRMVSRSAPLDALVLPVRRDATRAATPTIDRGISRPPLVVAGTAELTSGRRICFTGRTSGADRCGRLRGTGARPAERLLSLRAGTVVRCTTARAAPGDSGAAVYTAPRTDGTVRALGIATLVVGRGRLMCFTPVRPVLQRIGATLSIG